MEFGIISQIGRDFVNNRQIPGTGLDYVGFHATLDPTKHSMWFFTERISNAWYHN